MSEPENFLERWSRRKRQAEQPSAAELAAPAPQAEPAPQPEQAPKATESETCDVAGAIADAAKAEFDAASLPPIESIDATSDIRAFLAPGVPAELTRAALRRAWLADPNIRDFIGIAENQWDFTAPDGVPGFGSLPFGPQLTRMVGNLLEAQAHVPEPQDSQESVQSAESPDAAGISAAPPPIAGAKPADMAAADDAVRQAPEAAEQAVGAADNAAAAQNKAAGDEDSPRTAHRRHGTALPRS
jgi:hypothetical protein